MRLRGKRILGAVLIAAILIGAAGYLSAAHLLVYIFSRAHHLVIEYKGLDNRAFTTICFDEIRILDRDKKIGLFSKYAVLKPLSWTFSPVPQSISFRLKDVHFIAKAPGAHEAYDSLPALMAIPFKTGWYYKEVTGTIRQLKEGIRLDNFQAISDTIRLSINGTRYNDNTIDAEITIQFRGELVSKIPAELAQVVLKDAPGGWKSFSVRMRGNYESPSIEISGRLFRLNIRSVPKPKGPTS